VHSALVRLKQWMLFPCYSAKAQLVGLGVVRASQLAPRSVGQTTQVLAAVSLAEPPLPRAA